MNAVFCGTTIAVFSTATRTMNATIAKNINDPLTIILFLSQLSTLNSQLLTFNS